MPTTDPVILEPSRPVPVRHLRQRRIYLPTPAPAVVPTARKIYPRTTRQWFIQLSLLFAMLCVTAVALIFGNNLRQSLFDAFPVLRGTGDITNAFIQGEKVVNIARKAVSDRAKLDKTDDGPIKNPGPGDLYRAWVKRYDDSYALGMQPIEAAKAAGDRQHILDVPRFDFDYVPLRLAIPTLWVNNIQRKDPTATGWQNSYTFTAPLLHVNTAMELLTALAMFLLVRHWVLRASQPPAEIGPDGLLSVVDPAPPTIRAWGLGWLAAMLVWFEPSVIVEGHIWPQWDVWIMPSFLLAAYFGSTRWWFSAGFALGIGAMMKGQLLFVAPLFVLWPIFARQWGAAVRATVGFATSFLLIASPWLLETRQARGLVLLSAGACAILLPFFWLKRTSWMFGVISTLVGIALVAPFVISHNPSAIVLGALLAAVVLAGPWRLPKRSAGVWIMAVLCAATVLGALCWDGSWAWWHIGFGYGTRHYPVMYMGPSVNNLPAILHDVYGWDLQDKVFSIHLPAWAAGHLPVNFLEAQTAGRPASADGEFVVTIKALLIFLYAIALVLCSWAAARHARRNDRRFLVAIVAPWVIFFAVTAQMHERYLFWAAVAGIAGIGVSFGMTLLWMVVSLISVGMIVQCQLWTRHPPYPTYSPGWDKFLQNVRLTMNGAHPGLGWAVILLAGVYLYLAVTSSRKRLREKKT